jgi:hypothetical protein
LHAYIPRRSRREGVAATEQSSELARTEMMDNDGFVARVVSPEESAFGNAIAAR